jgi:hypothetical protein
LGYAASRVIVEKDLRKGAGVLKLKIRKDADIIVPNKKPLAPLTPAKKIVIKKKKAAVIEALVRVENRINDNSSVDNFKRPRDYDRAISSWLQGKKCPRCDRGMRIAHIDKVEYCSAPLDICNYQFDR